MNKEEIDMSDHERKWHCKECQEWVELGKEGNPHIKTL